MKIELPEIKSKFYVVEDVYLRATKSDNIIAYIIKDLYGVAYPKYDRSYSMVKNYKTTVPKDGMTVYEYCKNVAKQVPPYIKLDQNGYAHMDYCIEAGTIFSFHRIKWTLQQDYAHVALKIGKGYNKGRNMDWLELVCNNGWARPVEKKSAYIIEFSPSDFAQINFEKVVV